MCPLWNEYPVSLGPGVDVAGKTRLEWKPLSSDVNNRTFCVKKTKNNNTLIYNIKDYARN